MRTRREKTEEGWQNNNEEVQNKAHPTEAILPGRGRFSEAALATAPHPRPRRGFAGPAADSPAGGLPLGGFAPKPPGFIALRARAAGWPRTIPPPFPRAALAPKAINPRGSGGLVPQMQRLRHEVHKNSGRSQSFCLTSSAFSSLIPIPLSPFPCQSSSVLGCGTSRDGKSVKSVIAHGFFLAISAMARTAAAISSSVFP